MQTTPPPLQRPDLSGRFVSWLSGLPQERRQQLRTRAADVARDRGLVVLREAGDVDIPLALSPEVAPAALLEERGADARAVLDGVVAAARHVLSAGVDAPRAQLLFGHFGPLETECLSLWREAATVTIARPLPTSRVRTQTSRNATGSRISSRTGRQMPQLTNRGAQSHPKVKAALRVQMLS